MITDDNTLGARRRKLLYRSWHRGTREMDLLLGSFAERHLGGFWDTELDAYEAILELSDPDLYNWISGQEALPANLINSVWELLLSHRFAT